jgi:hypothetical protein
LALFSGEKKYSHLAEKKAFPRNSRLVRRLGADAIIFEIFLPKTLAEKLQFFAQIAASLCQRVIG